MLAVLKGEKFHVSAVVNRWSIERHGLDWRRMGPTGGMAGSSRPELKAVFVSETVDEADFFVNIAREPTDVWAIDCEGSRAEGGA